MRVEDRKVAHSRNDGGMLCSQHKLPIIGMHSLSPTERFPKVSKKLNNVKGLAAIPVCRECKL